MDPRKQFMNQDFVQYAAECRRMARLARKPAGKTVVAHPSFGQQLAALLDHLFPRPPLRHAGPAVGVQHRFV